MINWLLYNDLSQWFFSTPFGNWWLTGGIFMIPLAMCSIWGLALIIVKYVQITASSVKTKKLLTQINQMMKNKDIQGAINLCENTKGPIAAIILAGLGRVKEGADRVMKAIENTGTIELAFLERGLVAMATNVSIAPMFGFLGTVSGMINAFAVIEKLGEVTPQAVAAGIKEALITTECGLCIAIPVQVFHNYFIGKIDALILSMEESSQNIVEAVIALQNETPAKTFAGK